MAESTNVDSLNLVSHLRLWALTSVVSLSMMLEAAVGVNVTKVQQRYPWNGLVDIDYTVMCDDVNADVYVFPEGTDNDRNLVLRMRTLAGDGASAAVKPGAHRMTWNAAKDMPSFHSSNISVKMSACRGAALYMVVDLSGGAEATQYPVRYSAQGPDLLDDKCRTTELWLRLILPGTFTMGSPANEAYRMANEVLHGVTITQPYYIGVFEITQKQCQLVMNANPSYFTGEGQPVEKVSYNMIRGTGLGAEFPAHQQVDSDSFMGRLSARTAMTFDLPTEAQWEYACRAGTSTALSNGQNNPYDPGAVSELARYASNQKDGRGESEYHAKVGSYAPNAWGLYDMYGNVFEWCRDWLGNLTTDAATDPKGVESGTSRVFRGGSWSTQEYYLRSSRRDGSGPTSQYTNVGLRVAAYPMQFE